MEERETALEPQPSVIVKDYNAIPQVTPDGTPSNGNGYTVGNGPSNGTDRNGSQAPQLDAVTILEQAIVKGYEGDSCAECGQFTMVRNGSCLKCDSCGATSGCS